MQRTELVVPRASFVRDSYHTCDAYRTDET